ncbi:MAG TPA: nucleoside-diphosphate sugar epimerase/dehydratase [Acidimicrobiia bacterium]|nr:nucleoside-diphosphate sugar epimerase/dehydratase [Acidimicrobiia bacterium]
MGGTVLGRGQRLAVAASRVQADIAFAITDLFIVVASYTLGLGLRMLDPLVGDSPNLWVDLARAMPVIVLVHLAANVLCGAYGHVWEHASTSEAARVVVANAAAGAVVVGGNFALRAATGGEVVIPWLTIVVGPLISLYAMGLVRFRSRLFSYHRLSGAHKVLVVGTGRDAVAFARQAPLLGSRRVIGFLSDGPSGNVQANGSRRLAGLQILGAVEDIAQVVTSHGIEEVIVVGGDSVRARRVVDLCLDVDVRLRLLPSAEDVLQDGVSAVDARDIEVEDLLIRQPVETDLASVRHLLEGKRVLVTGAGGSIGSEIVRQVFQFSPLMVCALDRDETLLHDGALRWEGDVTVALADVRDAERILRIFEEFRPQVVFHAAALKHVPVLEDHAEEAVLTNIIGTRNVIEAGSRNGMERFVLISTDKAVVPSSVMGATKRAAELMTQSGSSRKDGCVYTAVRFGNVLGSRGSVIPLFVEQIKRGGPVTVTDPGMTRYFMTVDEAVQLVLQASTLATGSEIYLLDMGEPVRIEDLARRLIRLAGLSPEKDVEIRFTGRRPGEKLTEMLALDPLDPTRHEKIFEVRLSSPLAHVVMDSVAELEKLALAGDTGLVTEILRELTGGDLLSAKADITIETDAPAEVPWS